MIRHALAAGAVAVAGVAALTWSGGAAGAATDTEAFLITQEGTTATVVTHGVFDDTGTDTQKSQLDNFRLSAGGITVFHPDADGTFTFTLNPATCTARVKVAGTYTLGNGKRAYRGISGTGSYHGRGTDVLARKADGTCDFSAEPVSSTFVVHGSGPVSFSS